MNFKRKVFLIIIGGLGIMIAGLLALTRYAYQLTADSIARQEVLYTFDHAKALLTNDLEHLRILNADWSIWNDSYEYALNRNERFVESNLQESTFKTLNLTSFSIHDSHDVLLFTFSSISEPEQKKFLDFLSSLRAKALKNGKASAIIEFSGDYFFSSAHQILKSDKSGPAAGILVMTRSANKEALSSMMTILESDISLEKLSADTNAEVLRESIETKGQYSAAGTILDIADPTILLHVRPRKRTIIFDATSFVSFIVAGIVIAAFVTLIILLLLDRYIIRRINRIGKELETAAASAKHTYRVTVDGDDEISRLGHILNQTFDSLEKSFAENERSRSLLEHSLSERESLFQEIRHRVKNNLQVVASLLSLQSDDAGNQETAEAFQKSMRRVLAMAFVHEELYCSDSLDSINLHDYLERLSILIRHALDPAGLIGFQLDSENIELPIERAVPFALIANEVLSNAYIHAFNGIDKAAKKSVTLDLRSENDGSYRLSVIDNGVGIARNPPSPGTLGLVLIDSLSAQLRAPYSYASRAEGGTRFTLQFSAK